MAHSEWYIDFKKRQFSAAKEVLDCLKTDKSSFNADDFIDFYNSCEECGLGYKDFIKLFESEEIKKIFSIKDGADLIRFFEATSNSNEKKLIRDTVIKSHGDSLVGIVGLSHLAQLSLFQPEDKQLAMMFLSDEVWRFFLENTEQFFVSLMSLNAFLEKNAKYTLVKKNELFELYKKIGVGTLITLCKENKDKKDPTFLQVIVSLPTDKRKDFLLLAENHLLTFKPPSLRNLICLIDQAHQVDLLEQLYKKQILLQLLTYENIEKLLRNKLALCDEAKKFLRGVLAENPELALKAKLSFQQKKLVNMSLFAQQKKSTEEEKPSKYSYS